MAADHEDAVLLEKLDRGKRMARVYALSIEPTLFAETALVRRWGRIGTTGRQRIDLHLSPAEAGGELRRWSARKVRRGYSPRD